MEIKAVYDMLLQHYGRQEWWPVKGKFEPREFEVCVGAILTQNTNWNNVEKALRLLEKNNFVSPEKISSADTNELEAAIKPSGFYRQKAERLKAFSGFIVESGGFKKFSEKITREQLLSMKGIGPETADSILLYALGRTYFVIDAYTKRIFSRFGIKPKKDYEEWLSLIHI